MLNPASKRDEKSMVGYQSERRDTKTKQSKADITAIQMASMELPEKKKFFENDLINIAKEDQSNGENSQERHMEIQDDHPKSFVQKFKVVKVSQSSRGKTKPNNELSQKVQL